MSIHDTLFVWSGFNLPFHNGSSHFSTSSVPDADLVGCKRQRAPLPLCFCLVGQGRAWQEIGGWRKIERLGCLLQGHCMLADFSWLTATAPLKLPSHTAHTFKVRAITSSSSHFGSTAGNGAQSSLLLVAQCCTTPGHSFILYPPPYKEFHFQTRLKLPSLNGPSVWNPLKSCLSLTLQMRLFILGSSVTDTLMLLNKCLLNLYLLIVFLSAHRSSM
jgi:hypothetical protein